MKIYVLTPNYPSASTPVGTTPVVHYFAREWVKMGHEVVVFHWETKYLFFIYWVTKLFARLIYSRRGSAVYTKAPKEYDEVREGVKIIHAIIKKKLPSPRFQQNQVDRAYQKVIDFCNENGAADLFVGHWDNPQLEILNRIKEKYPLKTTALVFHSLVRDLNEIYPGAFQQLMERIDVVGFRSYPAKQLFQEKYFKPSRCFIASSGISESFLSGSVNKNFERGVSHFIFVGSLILRKHPRALLKAVSSVYNDAPFCVTYVGDGAEAELIKEDCSRMNANEKVILTGRIPRSETIKYLDKSEVFTMISDHETFGLVYLEAMARGCITIASRGGGIDGIIIDGENGFLCNPGDVEDLKNTITRIKCLTPAQLSEISNKAINTARMYTDHRVAEAYLNHIFSGANEVIC